MSKTHKIAQLKKRIATMERKLREFRTYLVNDTEHFQKLSKSPNASPCGSHYDRGEAAGLIHARAELERLFDYWDN